MEAQAWDNLHSGWVGYYWMGTSGVWILGNEGLQYLNTERNIPGSMDFICY
jgi:hypothetical protein